MNDVLNGKIKLKNKYKIIDCRFPYEYEGGHLRGSQNLYLAETIEELFFQNPEDCVLIFHCEYSKERGPKMFVISSKNFLIFFFQILVIELSEILIDN